MIRSHSNTLRIAYYFPASLNINSHVWELYWLVSPLLVSPQVISAAGHIVERAVEGGAIGGRSPNNVCGAALYMAARVR